jgi:hypothetical protein
MDIVRRAITPLRVGLVLTFALLVVFQTLSFPGQFAAMADEHPEDAFLRWPLTAFFALEILCAQVVLVSTWKLLGMVQQDRIFSEQSFRWVDAIIGAIGVGWVLLVGLFLFVGFSADDPGLPMVMLMAVLLGGSFGLLMLVMRALLRQATDLRTDMEAVI